MVSSSRSEIPVSRSGARQSLPFSTELLRTVDLGHLAASFWNLIVEPGLDKEWDPLSPLLHSSFQLLEIATSFLSEILGETRFKDHPARTSVKTNKLFLSELKWLKALGETGDPTVILELDTMFAATMAGLHECDPPILWLARECAVRRLHLRIPEMCPTIEQDVDLQQKLSHYADYVVAAQAVVIVSAVLVAVVSESVYVPLFCPAKKHILSLIVLSKKITALRFISYFVLDNMHRARAYWDFMDHRRVEVSGLIRSSTKLRTALLHDSLCTAETLGIGVEGLSICRETLDAIQFREALESLRPLPGDDLMLECRRRLRDHMLSGLSCAQKEEHLAFCSLEPLEPSLKLRALKDLFLVIPTSLA